VAPPEKKHLGGEQKGRHITNGVARYPVVRWQKLFGPLSKIGK